MSDQLPMLNPKTCEDTPSAISLPESGSGHMPCGSPDGQTIAKSGPAHAPASHSARPAKAKRSTIKGIFGQLGFFSSKHDDLSFALASRYRRLTDSLGSTLFELTWMTRITPMGFSIPAQRASEPRTEGSVCIGWPTPNAGPQNDQDTKWEERREEIRKNGINGNGFGLTLGMASSLCGWPTPQTSDMTGGGQAKRVDGRANLNDFAMLASWGTPAAHDWKMGDASQETLDRNARPLNEQAMLASWQSPTVNDSKGSDYTYSHGNHEKPFLKLPGEAELTAFGDKPIGFLLGPNGWEIVPASVQLNPGHSRWLMGLPRVWDDCAVTAMASLRKRRRRS